MKNLCMLVAIAGLSVSSLALFGCDKNKSDSKSNTVASKSLWDRLGGEKNVRKVVDDFVGRSASDLEVNFTRKGIPGVKEVQLTDASVAALKQRLVEFISANTGGPYKYTGKDMKSSHAGMKITTAQFNKIAGHLKAALDAGGAAPADRDAVMGVAASTMKDMVEVP